ncbi:hypothetical protein Hte_006136 [Hypoxylon texense]
MARMKKTARKSSGAGKARHRDIGEGHEFFSDELTSSKPSTKDSYQQEDIADEITVRTALRSSQTSSRPSTANSGTASSRQSRRRITPTPVNEEDVEMLDAINSIEADELAGEGPALKKSKSAIKDITSTSRKGKSKYDNPDEMLTNPRAPLATTNLRDLLCSAKAWDLLNPEEQQQVLALFPDQKEIVAIADADADAGNTGNTDRAPRRPDVTALRNNDNFRHDAARYQDALAKGWHDPEWIRQARQAHANRKLGAYDEYLAARFEEDWGMRHDDQTLLGYDYGYGHRRGDGGDGDDDDDDGDDDDDAQEQGNDRSSRGEEQYSQQVPGQQESSGSAKKAEKGEEGPDPMDGLEKSSAVPIIRDSSIYD